jgi:Xaa-Pro aminopeptidase
MASVTNREVQIQSGGAEERLAALRRLMREHGIDAYLVPSTDEHINEYLPECKRRREWVSGFTGSAGDFLLTLEQAWLFVDSRYHEQADYEVDLGCIQVSKLGQEGQPALSEKVSELAGKAPGLRLGADPFTLSIHQAKTLREALEMQGGTWVVLSENLVDRVWEGQPPLPQETVFALPENITGQSVMQKLQAVRQKMNKAKTKVLPLTKLDQIAWLFNLRGQDIPYNPVFIAYAIVTDESAWLFTSQERLQPEAKASLEGQVQCLPYAAYTATLQQLVRQGSVLIDPKHTTYGTFNLVEQAGGKVIEAEHPVELLKAIKNEVEIRGMREANLKASRGKIRAWYWLERELEAGRRVTEKTFQEAIERFYAEEEAFIGLSFNTISGAGANSSIVHYGTPDPQKALEPGELFLIDSGCQFYGGTTDDTRTFLVGSEATELQRFRYTEVLKAHINCAMQKFPKGTEGIRIARATLWQHGLDYGHGTGHGVGAFLNVHEGPNGIHKLASKPFEPGMITSIEPGYYEPGWGGIRLENLYLTVEVGDGRYGFESLTYIPFDKKLIDFARLESRHLEWLKQYYAAILEKIGSTLSPDERNWLTNVCAI